MVGDLDDWQGRYNITGGVLAVQQVEQALATGIRESFERSHALFVLSDGYIAKKQYMDSRVHQQTKIGRQRRGFGRSPIALGHIAMEFLWVGLGRDNGEMTVVSVGPRGLAGLVNSLCRVREHTKAIIGALDAPLSERGENSILPRLIS